MLELDSDFELLDSLIAPKINHTPSTTICQLCSRPF